MKKLFFIVIILLSIQPLSATSIPSFPMTIYGTIQIGGTDLGTGAILSFTDGNDNIIYTYATTRAGWYGYDNSFSGISPTFSTFTGKLGISVQYGGKSYRMTSITSSTSACPSSNAIMFTSNVCRYDILLTIPASSNGSGGGGGGGGGSMGGSTTTSVVTTNNQAQTGSITSTGIASTGVNAVSNSGTLTELGKELNISSKEIKLNKSIIIDTQLKKGTKITVYRILPNGRKIRYITARVLVNGKIRFIPKVAGKYIVQ